MPRFHFHTEDGLRRTDDAGTELQDLRAAADVGVERLAQEVRAAGPEFWSNGRFHLTATDDQGLILFTLELVGTVSPAASNVIRR